jgi:hypothetical protein
VFEAWVVWLVWAGSLLVLEMVAVFSPRKGDTLSESVWHLLRHGGAIVLVPLYVWLGWHFFLEFWLFAELKDTAVDDLLIVGVVAAVTGSIQLWQRFRKPKRPPHQ